MCLNFGWSFTIPMRITNWFQIKNVIYLQKHFVSVSCSFSSNICLLSVSMFDVWRIIIQLVSNGLEIGIELLFIFPAFEKNQFKNSHANACWKCLKCFRFSDLNVCCCCYYHYYFILELNWYKWPGIQLN